jgi:uncharacterized membrane protein
MAPGRSSASSASTSAGLSRLPANYRAARAREEVSVSRTALDIRKTRRPAARAHRFNPFWARFAVARRTR